MTINAHRWDVAWVKHENIWKHKIQYSSDGKTFRDASSWMVSTQDDINRAQGNKIVLNFSPQTARYWRWVVADQNCATIRSWEFSGTVGTFILVFCIWYDVWPASVVNMPLVSSISSFFALFSTPSLIVRPVVCPGQAHACRRELRISYGLLPSASICRDGRKPRKLGS